MADLRALISVFRDARVWVARLDNDFTWCSWIDTEAALGEIDAVLTALASGRVPEVGVLFAPTGPMQELALSSGWGEEFLALADHYDAALATSPCRCFRDPLSAYDGRSLGLDRHYAEVSVLTCPTCELEWLHYFYESEGFSGSGRWYVGPLLTGGEVTADGAQELLERLDWYFYGGSYFGSTGRTSGPLAL